jgi:hypothetical protein
MIRARISGIDRDDGLLQLRPEVAGIAIGTNDDMAGGDRAAGSAHGPVGAGLRDRQSRALRVDEGAGGDRRAGKAPGIAERVEVAAAAVEQRRAVAVGAGAFAARGGVEEVDRHAALQALCCERGDRTLRGRVDRDAHRAGLARRAVYAVPLD